MQNVPRRLAGDDRPKTVAGAAAKYAPNARARFLPACKAAKIPYPPRALTLIALKEEKRLEVWATAPKRVLLATFPVLAASGTAGPKRREGDRQVPEGFYRLTALNPLSRFHLSIRVDYPNADDIQNSTVPRGQMGGDIYIHGDAVSIGCLALGDLAIEELFPLVTQIGLRQCQLLIAPRDFRRRPPDATGEPWLDRRYRQLAVALRRYR